MIISTTTFIQNNGCKFATKYAIDGIPTSFAEYDSQKHTLTLSKRKSEAGSYSVVLTATVKVE